MRVAAVVCLVLVGLVCASSFVSASAPTVCESACYTDFKTCISSCPTGGCSTLTPCCFGCGEAQGKCWMACQLAEGKTDTPSKAVPNFFMAREEIEAEAKAAVAAPATEAAAAAWNPTPVLEAVYQREFSQFVKRHTKSYTHDEFKIRYAIFKANYNKIRHHNMGSHSYSMAVNEFADQTFEEFHKKMTGLAPRQNEFARSMNNNGPHKQLKSMAASLDWRAKNAVTPVKNQQQCGSCWAFSTTGSTEGAHAIKTGKLVSLSEQQLVDCSAAEGNNGCNGGLMDQGFEFIIKNKGITTEAAYPYTAQDGTCKKNQAVAATLSKYVDVTKGSETDLMAAVNIGPVSVAIEADQQCFQFYSGGVLSDPSCGEQLDHGVLLVGYGTDAGKDFWIVKNSWGASWGESGYIRLIRGKNECGIAQMASYPVV